MHYRLNSTTRNVMPQRGTTIPCSSGGRKVTGTERTPAEGTTDCTSSIQLDRN